MDVNTSTTNHLLFKKLRNAGLLLFMVLLGASLHAQTYCTPTYTTGCTVGDQIENFTFNTISNLASGCNTNANSYIYYSNLSTTVTPGNTYNMTMQAGSQWSQGFGVWIDYNGDGDFQDPGEFVYASPTSSTNLYSTTVTIPVTAIPGTRRLRVRCNFANTVQSTESCSSFTFGETEDYNVLIVSPSPNDVGITAITAPTSGCGLGAAEQITVDLTNYGTLAQTGFTVNYQINGGTVVTENVGATSYAPTSTNSYTFTTPVNMATPGTYTIVSWTSLATDTTPINDTSVVTVTSIPGVNTFPYVQDFESGNGGWTSGGTNDSWAFGTPNKTNISGAASGINAWVNGGLAGTYSPNEDSYVISPCFDFSSLANPWIRIAINWFSEFSWDGAVLQSSTDFGTTWQNVGAFGEPFNWYNDNSLNGNPGGQQDGWTGTGTNASGGWLVARHALDSLAGESSVRLRIAFGSDGSVNQEGFAFDDVFIGDGPVPNIGPDSVLICGGDSLLLNAGSFVSYLWSSGDTTQLDTFLVPGTVTVRVEDTLGFYGFDTVVVDYSVPNVDLGMDSLKCPGDTLFLDADTFNVSPGATYLWQDGFTGEVYPAVAGGTYYVELTDSVGCQDRDTIVVTIAATAPVDAGNDTIVCIGEPVQLDASTSVPGADYFWSTGAFTPVVIVNSPGQYIVQVGFPGNCASFDTVNVGALPSPALALGPDRVECGNAVLDAGPGGTSYQWSTGASTQTINISTGGTYYVDINNSFGCSSSDTVVITMSTTPVVNLGPDQVLCNNQAVTLDAGNPGMSYFWSNAATSQTISVTNPGLYLVQVTNAAGCVGIDSVSLTQSVLSVGIPATLSLCDNASAVLDVGVSGMNYLWNDGSTNQTLSVSSAGTYSVQVTDQFGCIATGQTVVSSVPSLNAGITGPTTGTLFQPVQFQDATTAGTPVSWAWDFGDGNFSTQQNPNHTYLALNNYTVTLIVSDGTCNDTTTHMINVNTVISVDEELAGADINVYPNPSAGLFNLDIELQQHSDIGYEVLDLSGKLLHQRRLGIQSGVGEEIDLSGFARGVYVLKIDVDGQQLFRKLILQ